MSNISQSLLHPDQYRFGIKSPVLLYSLSISRLLYDSDYSMILITLRFRLLYDSDHNLQLTIITQSFTLLRFYNWKLHFVNRYCFCNTELRTAIITKIKLPFLLFFVLVVCWFSCSFMSEACAGFGEWL